jgi:hypothetical protein
LSLAQELLVRTREHLLSAAAGPLPYGKSHMSCRGMSWAPQRPLDRHVEWLRVGQAQVTATDKVGWLALHHAAFHGQPDVVRLLLDAGADPLVEVATEQLAYDLAKDGCVACAVRAMIGSLLHSLCLWFTTATVWSAATVWMAPW